MKQYNHLLYLLNIFTILNLSIFMNKVDSFSIFNHWHCIGIKENIDFSKPHKISIGELPLVVWKDDKKNQFVTNINICKHMGSKLDKGTITENGCLKCPYHGLEFSHADRFGETIEYQGKLFWSYEPKNVKPYGLPIYNNPNYVNSFLQIDMPCSLQDSAYNTLDLRHPEYVHSMGFGSKTQPQNIKSYKYGDRVAVSFDYFANNIMKTLNVNVKTTQNYNMYIYPNTAWSRVTYENKNLYIGVHFLPLEKKKTRWYVTLSHDYYDSLVGKKIMQLLASTILNQDFIQLQHQYEENELKKEILFQYIFKNEGSLLMLKDLIDEYNYPDLNACLELYKDYQKKTK